MAVRRTVCVTMPDVSKLMCFVCEAWFPCMHCRLLSKQLRGAEQHRQLLWVCVTRLIEIIVDDGVESRGHRKGVYEECFEVVGVAVGKHAVFGKMSAMEFALRWVGNEVAIGERMLNGPLKVDYEEGLAKAKAEAKTQWKVLGTCPICSEPIKGGAVIEIEKLGGKLHAACFKCTTCETSLRGVPYQIHDKQAFCNDCYYEKFAEKCTACGKVMREGFVKCSLGKFHPDCVVCALCEKVIGKGKFSTASGQISCEPCGAQAGGPKMLAAPGRRSPSPGVAKRGASPAPKAKAAVPAKAPARSSLGEAGLAAVSTVARKAPGPTAGAAKGKPKAKTKISMMAAKTALDGMGMDYASLA
eukprot:TRINITY_DN15516_c0_g1_i3.p1 TRINITY_DN15516_c0_g1~~TRINITY_DN15516_c0_g1_i3.p1  ORF type:complete len:357 (-),score=48.78 TRINITY_DN15516_c0_g1_i3:300-1370(-)